MRIHRTPLFLVLLLLGAGAAHGSDEPERQARARWCAAELAVADSLLGCGRYEQAGRRIEAALRTLGEDPLYGWQFQERLGVALLRSGDAVGALAAFEASARANPSRASVHRNLATTLMALNRRGRALSEFRQAVDLDPGDCDIRLEFAQVLLEFGNTDEAAIHLQRAAEMCGERTDILRALANLYLAQRNAAAAVDVLTRLLATEPTVEVRRNLQAALLGSGRDEELYDLLASLPAGQLSLEELQILIETEGRLHRAEISQACVQALGSRPRADRMVALEGAPPPAEARFWARIALNLLAAGRFEPALRAADRAVQLVPDNAVYRNNRVVLLTRLGRQEEARREWEHVLEIDPSLGKKPGAEPGGEPKGAG